MEETFEDSRTEDLIEVGFYYHAPSGDQPRRYEEINEAAKALAQAINKNVPPGREKALAMTQLQQSKMWANAGIACETAPKNS